MLSGLRAAAAIGDENDQAPLAYIVEEGDSKLIPGMIN